MKIFNSEFNPINYLEYIKSSVWSSLSPTSKKVIAVFFAAISLVALYISYQCVTKKRKISPPSSIPVENSRKEIPKSEERVHPINPSTIQYFLENRKKCIMTIVYVYCSTQYPEEMAKSDAIVDSLTKDMNLKSDAYICKIDRDIQKEIFQKYFDKEANFIYNGLIFYNKEHCQHSSSDFNENTISLANEQLKKDLEFRA